MLKVENLSVQIKNINILDSVSFKVSKFSSIIGRNGAGKTTLIRAIMSILPAQKGNISFYNNFLTDTKPYNMTKMGIGYMPEDRRLIPDLTVEDNILVPLWSLKNYNQKKITKIISKKLYLNLINVEDIVSAVKIILKNKIQPGKYILKNTNYLNIFNLVEYINKSNSNKIKVKWLSNSLIKDKILKYKKLNYWNPKKSNIENIKNLILN